MTEYFGPAVYGVDLVGDGDGDGVGVYPPVAPGFTPLHSHVYDPSAIHASGGGGVVPTTLHGALSELDRAVSEERAELDRVLDALRDTIARVETLERAVLDATP